LKCGIIGNPELFGHFEDDKDKILTRDSTMLEYIIAESVRFKAGVVAADERESGQRRVLNFGHTIGHALEAETGYRSLLHGVAVAWGMIAAADIAVRTKKTNANTARRIRDAVLNLGPLPQLTVRSRGVVRRLRADKKTRNGVVHFVLPREIGGVEIVNDFPEAVVSEAVDEIRRLSR